MKKNEKNSQQMIRYENNLCIFANEITLLLTKVLKIIVKMVSKFQEKKQSRNNEIAADFKRLLGEGTPVFTAKQYLAEKYNISTVTVYRILK